MAVRFALTMSATSGLAMGDSPIGKVLSMISDLQTNIIKEGEGSQKVYAEFSEYCEDRSRELGFQIKTGESDVDALKATIDEEASTISANTQKVEELVASVSSNEADLASATKIRELEAKDFQTEEKELMGTIDQISRASGIIEREMSKGGAAMLQLKNADSLVHALDVMVRASLIGTSDAAKLSSFMQQASVSEDDISEFAEDLGALAGAVYESKSGNILETLQGLQEKAESQLDDARKKETTAVQNFEMLKQSLDDEIKFANKEMDEAKAEIAAASEKKAEAEGELEATSKELAADVEAKQTLHHECMTKAEDFEAETKSRGEELAAMAKAKEIIEEATAEGAFSQLSFAQTALRSQLSTRADLKNFEAIRIIRGLARREHSSEIGLLATRMASAMRHGTSGVFDKIKAMISDMIAKLEKEGEADATKKSYCDKALTETNTKRDYKSDKIEALATKIESATAKSAQLTEEIATLQNELSASSKSQAEMDNLRSEEKAVFVESKAELDKGLKGIKLALQVLKEYYATEGAHGKSEGSSGGIIGLLEVCESNFSKNLAEITSEEESAVAAYGEGTKENSIQKVAKEGDVKYKTKEAKALDKTASELKADHDGLQEELDAVLEYLVQIKAECTVVPETYEEKHRRRTAEIEGLKQALDALGEPSLIQRSSTHRRPALRVRRAA
mmetsp:Transcript_97834/g.262898  ORF Transcript_97834/g.262898 Transcript_97834/m.262898 type:complete len:682 (-) Transcript_97834:123-2168(-)